MMQVPSTDCYRHDRSGMRDVAINIRSAKNDQAGIGHRFTCKRVDLTTSKRPFDLAQELWDFACEARPVQGTAFLTWQGRYRLTYAKFNAKLKFIAEAVGLDPRVISTHSLRNAGASALAAKGVPDQPMRSSAEVGRGRWRF